MGEASTQVSMKDLNLHAQPDQVYATEGGVIGSQVSAIERMTRLERFNGSEIKGALGFIENSGTVLASLMGIDRAGGEVRAASEFANNLDEKTFKAGVEKIMKLSPEKQIEILSGGLDSMKDVVKSLMEARAQAPELSGEVVMKGLKELGNWYKNGTKEDQDKIDKFFEGMSAARVQMWEAMHNMWDAQKSVDMGNFGRRGADVGMDTSESNKYKFSRVGGPLRKLAATVGSIPGGIGTRLGSLVLGADKMSDLQVSKNLARLRQRALDTSKGLDSDDLTMWRMGIVSTKELNITSKDDLAKIQLESPLTPDELAALQSGKELKKGKFQRAPQAEQIKYFVGYDIEKETDEKDPNGDPITKTVHVDGFFDKRRKDAEEKFFKARDTYLGYSTDNPAWKNAAKIAGGVIHAVGDADILIGGLPAGFTELVVKGVDYPGRFIGMVGKGAAEGVSFTIDGIESHIAGNSLEQLTAIAVVRMEATKNLATAIETGDEKSILNAAAIVRGSESLDARIKMKGSRDDATIKMTKGQNLGWSVALAVPELGRAALEDFTGGVLVDNQTKKVIDELNAKGNRLNGGAVLESIGTNARRNERASREKLVNWFSQATSEIGISPEYMTMEGQEQALKSGFGKIAEGIRKTVGPDTWLQNLPDFLESFTKPVSKVVPESLLTKFGESNLGKGLADLGSKALNTADAFSARFRPGGAWEIITSGSERKAPDVIQENLLDRMTKVKAATTFASERLVNAAKTDSNTGLEERHIDQAVELATLITLEDAQKGYAAEELLQVKRREQLDRAYKAISAVTTFSGAAALVGLGSNMLEGPVAALEDLARHSLSAASERLAEVQAAAAKIQELTKGLDMGGTEAGLSWDQFWKNVGVKFLEASVDVTDGAGKYMIEAKVIGPLLAKAALYAGAARGAWEAAPLRSRARTKLWQSTKVQ